MNTAEKLEDELMPVGWVADRLGVKPKTITNWVCAKKEGFPQGMKLGMSRCAQRRWRRGDIESYIKQQHDLAA